MRAMTVQQSRFLALVSNGERLAELSEKAADSEDTATLQVLKTMDSIEAKSQQLKTSMQSLYTDSGVQNLFKWILDIGNNIVKTFTQMTTVFNLPIPAILKIGTTFASLANVVTTVFGLFKAKTQATISALTSATKVEAKKRVAAVQEEVNEEQIIYSEQTLTRLKLIAQELNALNAKARSGIALTADEEQRKTELVRQAELERQNILSGKNGGITKKTAGTSLGLNMAGVALSTIAGSLDGKTQGGRQAKGWLGIGGSAASMAGMGLMMSGTPAGAGIGAAIGIIMGLFENMNLLIESTSDKINRLKDEAEEANNTYLQKNDSYKTYKEEIDNLEELRKARHDSKEANEEYIESSNKIAEQHPELITSYDAEGNAVLDLAASYGVLEEARLAALQAGADSAQTSIDLAYAQKNAAENDRDNKPLDAFYSSFAQTDKANRAFSEDLQRQIKNIYSNDAFENNSFFFETDEINHAIDGFVASLVGGTSSIEDAFTMSGLQQLGLSLDPLRSYLANFNNVINDPFSITHGTSLDYVKMMGYGDIKGYDFINDIIANIEEGNAEQASELIKKNSAQLTELSQVLEDATFDNFINNLQEYSGVIIKANADVVKAEKQIQMQERSGIAALTRNFMYADENDNTKNTEAFKEFDEINGLLSQYVYDRFKEYKEGLSEKEQKDAFKTFNTSGGALEAYDEIYGLVESLWKSAADSQKEDFNTLLGNSGKYSKKQFGEELKSIFPSINDELILQLQEQYYETAYSFSDYVQALASRYQEQDFTLLGSRRSDLLKTLGGDELQQVLNVYDNIAGQIKSNKITPDQGQNILDNYLDIWEATNSLDSTSREVAQGILNNWDNFSLVGLIELQEQLENTDLNEDVIAQVMQGAETFVNLIPENLTTDFETLTKQFSGKSEEFEKALSNATKGMDLDDAIKAAEKLDVSINDFQFQGGKYFFKNADAIKKAYYKGNEELFAELDEQYNKEIGELNVEIGQKTREGDTNGVKETQDKIKALQESYADFKAATEQWGEYQTNAFLIQNGMLTDFLKSVGAEDVEGQLSAINQLDFDNLDEAVKPYISELYNLVNGLSKGVFDKALSSIKGEGPQFIDTTGGTDEQRALIKRLGGETSDGIHYILDLTVQDIAQTQAEIIQAIKDGTITQQQGDSFLADLHTTEYEHNVYDAFSGLVKTYDNFSYEAAQSFLRAMGDTRTPEELFGASDAAGNFATSYELMSGLLDSKIGELGVKRYNELKAQLESKQHELSDTAVLSTVIQNRDKLSEENVASLATLLKKPYDEVLEILHQNADGTYSINLSTIIAELDHAGIVINEAISNLIADQINTVLTNITGLAGSQSKGFTDLASMQKYISALREQGVTIDGQEASFQNLFEYNDALRAYQLTSAGIIANIAANMAQIEGLEASLQDVNDEGERAQIQDQIDVLKRFNADTAKSFADAIDVQGFLDLEVGDPARSLKIAELKKAISDYNSALLAAGETEGLNTNRIIAALTLGGENAVEAAQAIADAKGTTLNASEIESAYKNQINKFVNAIDTVVAQPGEIVDRTTANIISKAGGQVSQIGTTGQYVVQTAANLYEAYTLLLKRMANTGEATLADLNKVAALAFENKDGEQQVIDALGDAAGMTYTRLGEIFTAQGLQLTDYLVDLLSQQNIIKQLGGGKISIVDFSAFADFMNWDAGSEEYVSAFKTYNDSLIEMNRKAERNILEEAKSVTDIKPGDLINLTQLSNALNNQVTKNIVDYTGHTNFEITALDDLNSKLSELGAYISDGILHIEENADLIGVMQAVQAAAESSGGMLSSEIAELADAIAEAISGYTELITNGIKGGLSNVQADSLQQFANSYGVGKLDFSRTENGLKLSNQSAIKLYDTISRIDVIQGKLVFNELRSALEESNSEVSNISKTTNAIIRVQNEMTKNASQIAELERQGGQQDKIDKIQKENRGLQQQLNLYRQIATAQSNDPDSYNFMNRDMPQSFQGPINYWDSVGKAYSVMNDAAKSGKIGIQDFYNIVNEMSNTAQLSGQTIEFMGYQIDGSAENAAALIQKGFSALSNVDGSGVKIDLGKLGADISGGAANMAKGFDTGIRSMADSQIKMLDAAINMLEGIVAMQNIDIDGDGFLSMDELFEFDDNGKVSDFTKNTNDWLTQMDALTGGIEIGGKSLHDALLELAQSGEEGAQQVQDLMNQLYSIDWTLGDTDIFGQIQKILSGFFIGQEITQGTSIFDVLKVPKNAEKNSEEFKQWCEKAKISAKTGEDLITYLSSGKEINTHIGGNENAGISGYMRAIENLLELDDKAKQEVFEKFAGEKLSQDEIELFSGLTIDWNEDGTLGSAVYTASDGSSLTLSGDPESWQQEIADYEDQIYRVKASGGKISMENADSAETKEIDIDGSTYKVVYNGDAENPQWFGTFNGKSLGPYNSEDELKQALVDAAEAARGGGAYMAPINPSKGDSTIDVGGQYQVKYKWKVSKGTDRDSPEMKENAAQVLSMSKEQLQSAINAKKSEALKNGTPLVLDQLPGIEFDPNTVTADDITSAANELLGNSDLYAGLPDKIAEGIESAFSDATQIGEAIANAITTAFGALSSDEIGEQEITEVKAQIANLIISGVTNTTFGSTGLFGTGIGAGLFSSSALTIPEATAKVTNLKVDPSTESNAQTLGKGLGDQIGTGISQSTAAVEQATSMGEKIAAAAQAALDANPLEFSFKDGGSDNGGDKGGDKGNSNSGNGGGTPKASTATPAPIQQSVPSLDLSGLASEITTLGNNASGATNNVQTIADNLSTLDSSKLTTATESISSVDSSSIETIKTTAEGVSSDGIDAVKSAADGIDSSKADDAKKAINNIDSNGASEAKKAINNIKAPGSLNTSFSVKAKGNVGNFAHAKGNVALAGGQNTLMGELGPELVVSNGRYFIAGQNGAEFVNLDKDAIVFNHLQTRRLLDQGAIGSRGHATTNERNAVAFARGKMPMFGMAHAGNQDKTDSGTGNSNNEGPKSWTLSPTHWGIDWKKGTAGRGTGSKTGSISKAKGTGPAMASAAEALAALKQLRAMWESLRNASLKDMGGLGRGSGGGGGGGGSSADQEKAVAGVLKQVERWYNWLTKIEQTQRSINLLTKDYTLLEKKNASASEKLNNLKQQYQKYQENTATRAQFIEEQEEYRTKLQKNLNKSAFNAFYKANDDGTITLQNDAAFQKFTNGKTSVSGVTTQKTVEIKSASQAKKLNEKNKKWNEKNPNKEQKKTDYKVGDNYTTTGTTTTVKGITSGLKLMDELQKKDAYGNNVYDAAAQYKILAGFGLTDYIKTNLDGSVIDVSTDEGKKQAVENFYSKVDSEKEEFEKLTDSIYEQEEALREDAAAMAEINEKIESITDKVAGVNEGLDKWYNYTKKIEASQRRMNALTKEYDNLTKDNIANGAEIYNNLKKQREELEKQKQLNETYRDERKKDNDSLVKDLKNSNLKDFFTYATDTQGLYTTATFNDAKVVSNKKISGTTTSLKRDSAGYALDAEGKRADESGKMYATYEKGYSFDATGKNIIQIMEALTEQDANGQLKYTAEEQFAILKQLGLGSLMLYDSSGKKIYENESEITQDQMKSAVEAAIGRVKDTVEKVNANTDEIAKANEEAITIQGSIYEIENQIRDNNIDLENMLKDAVVQERQDEIDTRSEIKDAIKDAADKTVQGLRDSLDKEQKMRDNDKDAQELTKLQNQLTLLRMSNGSLAKLRDAQQKVQDKQEQMYFDKRQESIDNIEEASNKQVEALETQIDLMQTTLDYQVKTGLIWDQVYSLLNSDGPNSIAAYIAKWTPEFNSKSQEEQQKNFIDILEKAGIYDANMRDQKINESLTEKFGSSKDTSDAFKAELLKIAQDAYDNASGTNEDRMKAANAAVENRIGQRNTEIETQQRKDKAASDANKKIAELTKNPGKYKYDTSGMQKTVSDMYFNGKSDKEITDYINGQLSSQRQKQDADEAHETRKNNISTAANSIKTTKYAGLKLNTSNFSSIAEKAYDKATGTDAQKLQAAKDAIQGEVNSQIAAFEASRDQKWGSYSGNNTFLKTLNSKEVESLKKTYQDKYNATGDAAAAQKAVEDAIASKRNASRNSFTEWLKPWISHAKAVSPTYGEAAINARYTDVYNDVKGTFDQKAAAAEAAFEDLDFGTISNMVKDYEKANGIISMVAKSNIPYYASAANAKSKKSSKGKITQGQEVKIVGISTWKKSGVQIVKDANGRYYRFKSGSNAYILNDSYKNLPKFAHGGLIDYTGPAWVDGTKSNPEYILNSEQMDTLRSMLFSGVNTTRSSVSGLAAALDGMPNATTYNNINNTTDSGINIDHLDVHMEIKEIANDYDARRAGQQALEEMVRIARKTGTRSVSRR